MINVLQYIDLEVASENMRPSVSVLTDLMFYVVMFLLTKHDQVKNKG